MNDAAHTAWRVLGARLDEPSGAPVAILEGLPDAVVATASDGHIVFVNGLAEELFGYRREELVGRPVNILWPTRVRERYTNNMRLYFATEHAMRFSAEAWGLRRDGSEFIGEMSWGIVQTTAGPLLLAIGRDISEQRAAETRLRGLAAIGERALAGADPMDLAGEAVDLIRSTLPITAVEVRLADGARLASRGPMSEPDLRLPLAGGDELILIPTRPLTEPETSLVRAVAHTLATALVRLRDEERVRYEALHDPLTGLANRTLLRDRIEQAIGRSLREDTAPGVLFIDLDDFKEINDAQGHGAGDAVLEEVATRLRSVVRPGDTVARLGGDEFVVVCEHIDEETALALAGRLQLAIRGPLRLGGIDHALTASIGIGLGRADQDMLLGTADAAAYRAKARGHGHIEISRLDP